MSQLVKTGNALIEQNISAKPPKPEICALMSTRPNSAENPTQRFLIDRLRTAHARYPAIDLGIIGGSRVVSLARREADVALRYGSTCSTTRRFATRATCARCGSSPSRSQPPNQFGVTCRTDPSP